jgi:hypothetical protein
VQALAAATGWQHAQVVNYFAAQVFDAAIINAQQLFDTTLHSIGAHLLS